MTIRHRMILACSVVLIFAVGFLGYGIRLVSSAGNPADGHPYLTVSHARAAQARFSDARAAMERGLLLRESPPASHVGALEAAMKDVMAELKRVKDRRAATGSADAVSRAQALARDWYETGLQIIKPPPGGLTELPLPMIVASKGRAAAAALDQVVRETTAHAARSAPRANLAEAN
jgi:hypothetical protein